MSLEDVLPCALRVWRSNILLVSFDGLLTQSPCTRFQYVCKQVVAPVKTPVDFVFDYDTLRNTGKHGAQKKIFIEFEQHCIQR